MVGCVTTPSRMDAYNIIPEGNMKSCKWLLLEQGWADFSMVWSTSNFLKVLQFTQCRRCSFIPSANKKRIIVPISTLMQIDNGVALLNCLLHPEDCEERLVTRCMEVLPTIPPSTLDTRSCILR
ncbi:hypothetical protein TNCV_1228351 [Trichonephila clavipes]|nr:hypothetical protein TNCV_1228351 [Trichonephila clavipes]